MATAQVIGQARDTDCSVCHEHFKEPKILPCGHVVCRPCLVSWLRAQPKAGCPLCRHAVLEKEVQLESLEAEVGALPTDLALAELSEARAVLDKDHTCCACEDVVATALCLHCRDMMCASCTKIHGKMSMSKHHKVEDLPTVTPAMLIANRPPSCSSHPDLAKTMFCPTHGMSVCFQCATIEHRTCPDLKVLEEKTEEARAMLSKMAASLTASESEVKEAIQRLEHHILATEEKVQADIAQIQKTCDRLESGVKSCRGRMSDMARNASSEIQDRAQAAIRILQGRKSQMTQHTAVVHRAEGSNVTVTVSDMQSLMQARVQTLDCSVTLPASAKVCSTMSFVIAERAVKQMEQALAELGQVHLVPADHLAIFPQSQTREFIFRAKHGTQIVLSNTNLTATHDIRTVQVQVQVQQHNMNIDNLPRIRYQDQVQQNNGIILSRDPISADVMYEVRLDKWGLGGEMAVGVVVDCPDNVTLPRWSGLLPCATTVSVQGVTLSGTTEQVKDPMISVMRELREGDHVGVLLDKSHCLHLYLNGEDRGVWATAVTGLCHALVDLWGKGKKQVTALPLTTIIR